MDLERELHQVVRSVRRHIGTGKVADYIPALAQVDPEKFGLAVVTLDGDEQTIGPPCP